MSVLTVARCWSSPLNGLPHPRHALLCFSWLWLRARSLPPWHPLQDCQPCRRSSRSHGLLVKCQVSRLVAIISGVPIGYYINTLTVETVTDFIFLVSKITADGDCSHEINRPLFLGRKAMTNLDSILKSGDMEKEMTTHSSVLAWRIPWTEEPGGLQSMGSKRVGYYFTFTFSLQLRRLSALVFAVDFLEFSKTCDHILSCLFSNWITLHTVV